MISCPLCASQGDFAAITGLMDRVFRRCDNCNLVFVEQHFLPEREEEKARYDQHNNSIDEPGYVNFLNLAVMPALPYLSKGMKGLDYGCGPGPTLSILLEREGYPCGNYDPIYFPDLPAGPFDFIFATECFEHFFDPAKELNRLKQLLKPGGLLVVMTKFWEHFDQFTNWFYSNDNTHVTFYRTDTFQYVCRQFGFSMIETDGDRIVILRNNVS
ncbi:MAG: class I SAM-dependent methyltransferase [Mangrovibacterium sp.]